MVNPKAVMDVDLLTRWADMPMWTIREACALSMNLDPADHMTGYYGVGPERVPNSWSGKLAFQREELCIRAAASGDLPLVDPWERIFVGGKGAHTARVRPKEFLAWAKGKSTFNGELGAPLSLWASIVARGSPDQSSEAASGADMTGPNEVLALRGRFISVDDAVGAAAQYVNGTEGDAATLLLHMMESGEPRLQSVILFSVSDGDSIPLRMEYALPERAAVLAGRLQEHRSGIAREPRRLVHGWMLEDFTSWALQRAFDEAGLRAAIQHVRSAHERPRLKTAREIMEEESGIADARAWARERESLLMRVTELEACGVRKWPWGAHETELLRRLVDAAVRFWVNFDPADRTTAPKNADVIAWLCERGVARRNAEFMATLLRADNLPTGPRT